MHSHISGGMSKDYLSKIGKSNKVDGRVRSVATQAKIIAEGIGNGYGRAKSSHTKISVLGPGIWNTTYVLHARSAVARKNAKAILNTSAQRAGARLHRR